MEMGALLYWCSYNKTSVLCGSRLEFVETLHFLKIHSACHMEVIPYDVRLCVLLSEVCI
jgi:hypothetical protein